MRYKRKLSENEILNENEMIKMRRERERDKKNFKNYLY